MDAIVVINDSKYNYSKAGVHTIISNRIRQNWEILPEHSSLKGRVIYLKLGKLHILNIYFPANRESHNDVLKI